MFRQMDLKGKNSKDDMQLKTVHQNTIATLRAYEVARGVVRKFSCELCLFFILFFPPIYVMEGGLRERERDGVLGLTSGFFAGCS